MIPELVLANTLVFSSSSSSTYALNLTYCFKECGFKQSFVDICEKKVRLKQLIVICHVL